MKRKGMKNGASLFILVIFIMTMGFITTSYGEIIPASRRINWNPGIPGGIPSRTTIRTTIDSATYGNGTTDATSVIQAAISSCPVGQVVYIPSGTYKVSGTISVNKGIVLRGAGSGSTVINLGGTGKFTMTGSSGTSFNQTISSGYTKGSTSLTLTSTSGLSVGDYVAVTETKDPTGTLQGWPVDDKGCSWCGNNNGDYLMTQIVKVTAISSNIVTIEKPLYVTYASGLTPRVMNAIGNANPLVNAGFEDFTINAGGTSSVMAFQRAVNCWIKNVEIKQFGQYGIIFKNSYGCVVQGCKIHHGASETASSYGSGRAYGVQIMMWNSDHLVENNVLYHLRHMLSYEGGGSGCVFAYNYMFDSFDDANGFPNQTWLMGQIQTHGSHPYMNLWEGNYFEHIMQDYTWGSDSHNTSFRNRIAGRGATTVNFNRVALEIQKNNWNANIVGNVLGYSGMSGSYEVSGSGTGIYLLGNTSDGGTSGTDPGVKSTLYRHGNYDYVNNATMWDAGNSDHSIPSSLYLSSAPSWWCSETPWPPIGPDVSPLVSDIPSLRAYNGQTCNNVGGRSPTEIPKIPGTPTGISIN
jgi:hypothetical protein